jgi:hypothetical protein
MRVQRHLQAVIHPVLAAQILEPAALLLEPAVAVRVAGQLVAPVVGFRHEFRVALRGPGRAAVGLGDLGIHPEEPRVVDRRSRGLLEPAAQVGKVGMERLVAVPRLRMVAIHLERVGLHVDAQDDRDPGFG